MEGNLNGNLRETFPFEPRYLVTEAIADFAYS
jgi:hypothetical protein